MDDEELSELAECLEDACQEAERTGLRVYDGYLMPDSSCCPFGALIYRRFPGRLHPWPWDVNAGVPRDVVEGFMRGFDNKPSRDGVIDERAFTLGRQFRERYVGGGK